MYITDIKKKQRTDKNPIIILLAVHCTRVADYGFKYMYTKTCLT